MQYTSNLSAKGLLIFCLAFLLLSGLVGRQAFGAGVVEPALGDPQPTPSAVGYIVKSLAEFDRTLYVYKDFDDGANNYTQKAWMGDSYENIPAMQEDALGLNGTTGISAEIDFNRHSWGGYLFVNGILKAGQIVPELDFGNSDAGLDLTGAKSLIFFARGEKGGERVEFVLGGLGSGNRLESPYPDTLGRKSLGYVTLERNWKRYEIHLEENDLSRVACGFGWVTNRANNSGANSIKFYLDDILFEFVEPRRLPMYVTSFAPAPPNTDAAILNNAAYLYDNALAILALSYADLPVRARQIADAIVYSLDHDRYFTDGRLRNAYIGGQPKSFPGWFSPLGQEFARLPNFWDKKAGKSFEDKYMVGTTSGNCAWTIMALLEVYANSPDQVVYLDAARRIADFVLTLESAPGFSAGYEGWEPEPTKITYKSTEHNIDLVAAFGRLAALTKDEKYRLAAESAKAFVLSMRNPDKGFFYTGTTNDGMTINRSVVPLDCQTWSILALGDGIGDVEKVTAFIEKHMGIDGGYDFDADSKDGVWNEGTAQVGVLYQMLGDNASAAKILDFLNNNRLPDGSLTAADRDGVTTGFLASGTDSPWLINHRQHLGATAWLFFLQLGRNPFAY
jgi:hypothetical protein